MPPAGAPELLLLVSTSSYRLDDFRAAAQRRGVGLLVGTDRCHELAALWPEEAFGSLALDFRDLDTAVATIVARGRERGIRAIVPTDELTAVLAARAAAALGLRGNAPASALIARSKARLRATLTAAGLPCPGPVRLASVDEDPRALAADLVYPLVVKPLSLSGSRGVIRADDPEGFVRAFSRTATLLRRPELRALGGEDGDLVLIEPFVDGAEVAQEALLRDGQLLPLALFDKPDPLLGPFFEETYYVTPSRHPAALQAEVAGLVARAARAMALTEGPVHAELRLGPDGPVLLEVAARSIGGLCARALRFGLGEQALEELVIDAALGELGEPPALRGAAGVLMIPTPRAGVLAGVDGVEAARAVPLIEDVVLSARIGEVLVPLPEGASYLGFIFARHPERSAAGAAAVEAALRAAQALLRYDVRTRLVDRG